MNVFIPFSICLFSKFGWAHFRSSSFRIESFVSAPFQLLDFLECIRSPPSSLAITWYTFQIISFGWIGLNETKIQLTINAKQDCFESHKPRLSASALTLGSCHPIVPAAIKLRNLFGMPSRQSLHTANSRHHEKTCRTDEVWNPNANTVSPGSFAWTKKSLGHSFLFPQIRTERDSSNGICQRTYKTWKFRQLSSRRADTILVLWSIWWHDTALEGNIHFFSLLSKFVVWEFWLDGA